MKKVILVILFLGLSQHSCYPQQIMDSLFTVLKAEKEDTNKVNTLNAIAFEFRNNDPDTSIYFSNNALSLAIKLNDKTGTADAYLNIGSATVNLGGYNAAIKNINDALKIYEPLLSSSKPANKPKILKQKTRAYSIVGNICFYQGNYPEALKNYLISLKIREQIGDKPGVASAYNNIASTYVEEGNYPEALKTNLAALKIREEMGDKEAIAASYNNIGNVYDGMLNYSEALKMNFAALKIRQQIGDKKGIANSYNNIGGIYTVQKNYREALTNHEASLKIRKRMRDKKGIATSYINIGNVYQQQNNYPDALKNYFAASKIGDKIGDKESIAFVYVNIGTVFAKQKKNNEASLYLNKGLLLSKEIGGLDYIKNAYAGLSTLDSAKGDFKQALMHYKLFVAYRDSLFNEDNTKRAVQSQMQYEFDKKESLTKAEQDKKDALTNAEIRRQKIVRDFSIVGVFAILSLGGFVFYNFRKRKQAENLQAISSERLRISRELHDDIGSTLSSIAVYSDVAKNRSLKNENPIEVLSKIGTASRVLIEKMSDIVWSLNPDNETFEQLLNRMQAFAAMILTPNNIAFEIKTEGELKTLLLTNEQRKNIFLIYKEALHNSVKYAACNNVFIVIEKLNNNLTLCINDNGNGFDARSFEEGRAEAYNGSGLKNMRARAAEMKAMITINSNKNAGTEIKLIVVVLD